VAQQIKCPTLDFGSSHDVRAVKSSPEWSPTSGSVLSVGSLLEILSLCSLPPRPMLSNKK